MTHRPQPAPDDAIPCPSDDEPEPPLVFLDVDGVLNSQHFMISQQEKLGAAYDCAGPSAIDPACVAWLAAFNSVAKADYVLSSSWRHCVSPGQMRRWLLELECPLRFVGKTGYGRLRGVEIAEYLHEHGEEPTRPVIVFDDERDLYPVDRRHIRTSPQTGLTCADIHKALKLLRGC